MQELAYVDNFFITIAEIGEDEMSRYRQNLMDLDKFLGPYPFDTYDKWNSFTKHISGNSGNLPR